MPITVGGTAITFNDGTTQSTAASGGVTSVATGNGLQGGTITTSGTLSVACPTFNTVGSYVFGGFNGSSTSITSGSNYSAGSGVNQVMSSSLFISCAVNYMILNNLSGTWKYMGATVSGIAAPTGIFCRVA